MNAQMVFPQSRLPDRGDATVFLVDGSGFFFRAYHAIPDLRRKSDGMLTNAVYGFLQVFKRFVARHEPRYLAVALDSGEPTFRSDLFEAYKSNRAEAPEELVRQFPYLERMLEAMGVAVVKQPGVEADDLIGTLAEKAAGAGFAVRILSSDKDMLQLVGPRVVVERETPGGTKLYDEAAVRQRYQCSPAQLVEVMGLMGDPTDCIPGVPGIGEKTAVALIAQFGSLEGVLANLDKISGPKRRQSLLEFAEQAKLSRELARIRRDVPLDVDIAGLERRPVDRPALSQLLTELEMHGELADLGTLETSGGCEYETVDTREALERWAARLRAAGGFAFDTETTSVDAMSARLVGLSFACEPGRAGYVPIAHKSGRNLELGVVQDVLGPLLADETVPKYGHNLKYDYLVAQRHGMTPAGMALDTLLAHYLLESSARNRTLDQLAVRYLSVHMIPIGQLIGKGTGRETFDEVDIPTATRYAAEDADMTLRLARLFQPQLEAQGLMPLLSDVEMPLLRILADMEATGVHLDVAVLERQNREVSGQMEALEEEIYRLAGRRFNLNSTQQLAEVLFDDLKLPAGRDRSTRAEVLEKLAAQGYDICCRIVDYRQMAKLRGTYLEALPRQVHPETGKLHTSYNQAVANTGRISSSDPNLQNIPIRTELGRRVREAFVAGPGCVLVSADYSQVELRILAHLSGDPGLQAAFLAGEDIHARTAAEVFGVPLDQVTSEQRGRAKAINFGLIYGMSAFGLAERLGIARGEAERYIERYFQRYARVKDYIEGVLAEARRTGAVRTLLGRRIEVGNLDSPRRSEAENARRVAINAPVQGTAADLLKKAMVGIDRRLAGRRARLILTVHDEVVLDCPEEELDWTKGMLREEMTGALSLSVALEVDVRWGPNWAALK